MLETFAPIVFMAVGLLVVVAAVFFHKLSTPPLREEVRAELSRKDLAERENLAAGRNLQQHRYAQISGRWYLRSSWDWNCYVAKDGFTYKGEWTQVISFDSKPALDVWCNQNAVFCA